MASSDQQEPEILGVSPDKLVSKEQFDATMAKILKDDDDHVLLSETPAPDIDILAGLLGVETAESIPKFTCRFVKGDEACASCGRHFSILDMARTGLEFHGKDFINATIFGKHGGHVFNNVTQLHQCYDCGEKAKWGMDYGCAMYGCGSP